MNYIQQLDTLNISLPLGVIDKYAADAFEAHETAGGLLLAQVTARHLKTPGLNLVRVNEHVGEVVLSLSAKLLGKDYPQFLTLDTMPRALDRINATGLLTFDTAAALAAAEPLLLHPGKNIQLTQELPDYLRLLQLLHVNPTYTLQNYRNEKTLSFEKKVSTRKAQEYAKLYDKAHEFEMSKNRGFRESLAALELAHVRTEFQGKSRFEVELKSKEKIRQFYELPKQQPLLLTEVLASPIDPVAKMYNRITGPLAACPEAVEERLFFAGLSAEEQAVMGQCKLFDYDLPTIKAVCFQNLSRPTRAKKLKAAATLVSRWRAQQGNLQGQDFELLDELRHRLAA